MTEIKNSTYFVRKTIVYYDEPVCVEKSLLDTFDPITAQSTNYKNWRAILDLKPVLIVVQGMVRFTALTKLLTILRHCMLIVDMILYH